MTPLGDRIQLFFVRLLRRLTQAWLDVARRVLFRPVPKAPKNILVYKTGNIGDIICAIPSLLAIRKAYPDARLTILSSPGPRGRLGAKEILEGANYIDELIVYYQEDLKDKKKRQELFKRLQKEKFDLFIQFPDEIVHVRTLFRNILFAKLLGVRSAVGFRVRTIQLFKKAQVRWTLEESEARALLDILRTSGLPLEEELEFRLPIGEKEKRKVDKILERIQEEKVPIVCLGPGGKTPAIRWPKERFAGIGAYLQTKHKAFIIIIGGREDRALVEEIRNGMDKKRSLALPGELSILESAELIQRCSFVVANSTGPIHVAAALGIPAVGIYSIREIPGTWFPYGTRHKVLLHRFQDCAYQSAECMRKSVLDVTVKEAQNACEEIINARGIQVI